MNVSILIWAVLALSPAQEGEARDLARAARERIRSVDGEEACAAKLKTAHRTVRGLFAAADCYEKVGHRAQAYWHAKAAERMAQKTHAGPKLRQAQQRVKRLEKKISWLALSTPKPVPGLLVVVDSLEATIDPVDRTRPLPVDPGEVTLVAIAPGLADWSTTVALEAGQTVQVELPELKPPAPPALVTPSLPEPIPVVPPRAPVVAMAPPPAPPGPAGTVSQAAPPAKAFDWGLSASTMGAFDSNVFDQAIGPVTAGGADIDVGANALVPVGARLTWNTAANFVTNYRGGASQDGSNTLKIDAVGKTGIDLFLLGQAPTPSKKTEPGPVMKLGLEAKYVFTANPVLGEPPWRVDETADALEPSDDTGDSGGGGDEEGANVSVGAQTFSNPNIHHRGSGALKWSYEPGKRLLLGADLSTMRDQVDVLDREKNPNFNEAAGGLSARYKLFPDYLWLTLGYGYEQRWYDMLTAPDGQTMQFGTHAMRVAIDIPFKWAKLKLGYDLRYKWVAVDTTQNRLRHQLQISAEIPLTKNFSAVLDGRYADTSAPNAPDSVRLLGIAGLRGKI